MAKKKQKKLKRYLHTYAHSSTTHNSQNVEATQMPINKRMDKESIVCVYNGLLLCFAMLSHLNHVHQFVTSWAVAHQAPLSMEFSWQEHWSGIGWVGLPYPPPEDCLNPGIEPTSHVSCIGRQVLYH